MAELTATASARQPKTAAMPFPRDRRGDFFGAVSQFAGSVSSVFKVFRVLLRCNAGRSCGQQPTDRRTPQVAASQSSACRLVRSIWSNTAVIIWWSPRIEAIAAAA
jgi:hypothetical protein